jgi:hypothetical protein
MRAYPAILLGSLAEGNVILIAGLGNLGVVSRETERNGNASVRADGEINGHRPVVLVKPLVLL